MAPNPALAQVVFGHLTMERVDAKTRTEPSSLEEPTVFKGAPQCSLFFHSVSIYAW